MSEANRVNPPNEAAKAEKAAEKAAAKAAKESRPIDPATGEPYKSGEVPLGKNEPVE